MRSQKILFLSLSFFLIIIISAGAQQKQQSQAKSIGPKWKRIFQLGESSYVRDIDMTPDGEYIGVKVPTYEGNRVDGEYIFFLNKNGNILFSQEFAKYPLDPYGIHPDLVRSIKFLKNGKYVLLNVRDCKKKREGSLIFCYNTEIWGLESIFYMPGEYIEPSPNGAFLVALPWINFEYIYGTMGEKTSIKRYREEEESNITVYSQIYTVKRGLSEWEGDKIAEVLGEVKLFNDGTHFVAHVPGEEIALYKINGEKVWSKSINGTVEISEDGNFIAIGGYKCVDLKMSKPYVYFFNKEGKLLWERDIGAKYRSIVKMSNNGKYIVASEYLDFDSEFFEGGGPPRLYLFDQNGKLLWKYIEPKLPPADYYTLWPINVSSEGYVIAKCSDDEIFVIDKKGNKIWKFDYEKGHRMPFCVPSYVKASENGKYICAVFDYHPGGGKTFGGIYFFDLTDVVK
jgi:outer membrane protein assembly factor BamB